MRKREAQVLSRRLAAATNEIESIRGEFDDATSQSRRAETPDETIADLLTEAIDALERADEAIGKAYPQSK